MNPKALLPAALALGISAASVAGSACFTAATLHSARTTTETHAPALRVRHCYLNDQQQLVVVIEGGVWQPGNQRETPRAPMSFAVDLRALAKEQAKGGAPVLPQKTLKAGVPEPDYLRRGGYQEMVFIERRGSPPGATQASLASTLARVEVSYRSAFPLQPNMRDSDYMGVQPVVTVHEVPGLGDVTFSVADISTTHHFGSLLLLPLAVPLDVVTAPLQLIFVLSYKG